MLVVLAGDYDMPGVFPQMPLHGAAVNTLLHRQQVAPVVLQLVNRFVYVGQGGVLLRFFEAVADLGLPAFGQFFEVAYFDFVLVEKRL